MTEKPTKKKPAAKKPTAEAATKKPTAKAEPKPVAKTAKPRKTASQKEIESLKGELQALTANYEDLQNRYGNLISTSINQTMESNRVIRGLIATRDATSNTVTWLLDAALCGFLNVGIPPATIVNRLNLILANSQR